MNNLMVDLETWGTAYGSAIRSIGAVQFDPYGTGTGAEFYMNISDASCEEHGLVKNVGTIAWWERQSKQAQDSLLQNQRTLTEAAVAFDGFFRRCRAVFVWGQGAGFDPVIWEGAMVRINRSVPWRFWDVRCTRTAYDMGQFDPRTVRRVGTYHNALDDCKHQVICVQRAYAKVHGKKSVEDIGG
jgi:hypothetical protein